MTMPTPRHNFVSRFLAPAVAIAALFAQTAAAPAQYRMDLPPDGPAITPQNPQIVARPNAQVPLDLPFTSAGGNAIKLGDLFNHGRPVIMMMVYFTCPQMCGFNQKHLAEAVREGPRDLKMGKDYDVVVVSIDPDDKPAVAASMRENYLKLMDRPAGQPGFTYLVGTESSIQKLADTIGFGYFRNPPGGTDKFAHTLGTFILTPAGHISKTIGDLSYTPDELHAALMTAADGKIGSSTIDKILIGCGAMRLNPNTGKYEQNQWFWAGTAGGLASLAFMAIFLSVMWRGEYKKYKAAKNQTPPTPPTDSFDPTLHPTP